MNKDFDYCFKIIIIGECGVGKTSLLIKYVDNTFGDQKSTIGVDFKMKTVCVKLKNGLTKIVKLQIWDTGGQERHQALVKTYCRHAQGALFVYAVNDYGTFEKIPQWIDLINKTDDTHILVRYLVGNKTDLGIAVPKDQRENLCREHNMEFIQTSACTGNSVDKLFEDMAKKLTENCMQIDTQIDKADVVMPQILDLDGNKPAQKSCCGGTN